MKTFASILVCAIFMSLTSATAQDTDAAAEAAQFAKNGGLQELCDDDKVIGCRTGAAFFSAEGGDQDLDIAFKLANRGCELADGASCFLASFIRGTYQNDQASQLYFAKEACKFKAYQGCFTAGLLTLKQDGYDNPKGNQYIREACEGGVEKACEFSATILEVTTPKSIEENAASDDPQLLYSAGLDYFHGNAEKGIAEDKKKGLSLFEKAAALGAINAQIDLGRILMFGRDAPQDTLRARTLLTPHAEAGIATAEHLLGLSYYFEGTDASDLRAREWLEKVATRVDDTEPSLIESASFLVAKIMLSQPNSSNGEIAFFLNIAKELGNEEAAREYDLHCLDYPSSCE